MLSFFLDLIFLSLNMGACLLATVSDRVNELTVELAFDWKRGERLSVGRGAEGGVIGMTGEGVAEVTGQRICRGWVKNRFLT